MPDLRTRGAKAANRARRWFLGLLLRLPGGQGGGLESLLERFPDEALMPLHRVGLDPVPALGALREREPVSRIKLPLGLRGWLVTGYEESKQVLAADLQTFSNDFSNMVGKVGIAAEQDPGGLGFADPPHHTRLRQMLTPHFTTRAVAKRTPRITQIIDDALDDMAAVAARDGQVDLLTHFALPIPSRTIMELLGVPEDDYAEFQRLSTERFDFAGGATESLDTIGVSIDYLEKIVVKARTEPGDGLISKLVTDFADASDVELAGLVDGVLTGGLETTVSMLALGAQVLLQDADAFAVMRDDDAAVDGFVDELLRYLTVVQVGFPRFAMRDMTLAGKSIFAGDVVLPSLSAANRDPRRGAGLETVDPHRAPTGHLAFGHGLHRCVGAELAKVELRLAYPALVRRFPKMALAVPASELSYRDVSVVYGIKALPVTLG